MVVISGLNWAKERRIVNAYSVSVTLLAFALGCAWIPVFPQFLLMVLRSEMIFSHLFYLPVALASVVWGTRGVWVAVLIGVTWMLAYFLSGIDVPPQEYFPQPVMFIIIGLTVGILRQQMLNSERNLRNRVKELHCLFRLSDLRDRPGLSVANILQGTVDLIPPAWQYPDVACARITLDGQTFTTANFAETRWRQTSNIVIQGERVGAIDVYYLESRPEADEGPFLEEERRLIDAVAERLGKLLQRERAETALRKSEATNRALVSAIPDSIWRIGEDGTLIDCKDAKDATALTLGEPAVGKRLAELLPQEIVSQTMQCVTRALQLRDTQVCEYRLPSRGITRFYEARFVVSGEHEVLAIVRDITDRKAREALIEEERIRIARDLHDGLAQSLYFLGLKLDFIRKQVTRDPASVLDDLLTLKKTTQKCIQDVRRTIFALRPVDLERQGFDPAIRQYTREFGEHMGLTVLLNVDGSTDTLPTSLELTFFRLVQEGLNNVAKHAQARQVWIDLSIAPGRVGKLVIRDDGVGFDPGSITPNGSGRMGLHQMRERVMSLGGFFHIESKPLQGTTLCSEIPL